MINSDWQHIRSKLLPKTSIPIYILSTENLSIEKYVRNCSGWIRNTPWGIECCSSEVNETFPVYVATKNSENNAKHFYFSGISCLSELGSDFTPKKLELKKYMDSRGLYPFSCWEGKNAVGEDIIRYGCFGGLKSFLTLPRVHVEQTDSSYIITKIDVSNRDGNIDHTENVLEWKQEKDVINELCGSKGYAKFLSYRLVNVSQKENKSIFTFDLGFNV